MDATKPPAWHFAQGARLKPLRDEGVLIMGTGNTVHNLSTMTRSAREAPPYDWAARFSNAMRDAVLQDDQHRLINYPLQGSAAAPPQPTPDHLWPLRYAMGARQPGDAVEVPVDHIEYKSIGITSIVVLTPRGAGTAAGAT